MAPSIRGNVQVNCTFFCSNSGTAEFNYSNQSHSISYSNNTQVANQKNGPFNETTIEPREISSKANQTTSTQNRTAEALPSPPPTEMSFLPITSTIARGYFSLGHWESVVHVTSDADFLTCIWALNVETFDGGLQVTTPPSQFRGRGSTGPYDGLVMDVPAQTGMDIGCIGADGGETINLTNAAGATITVYLTVITAQGTTVNMIGVPRP